MLAGVESALTRESAEDRTGGNTLPLLVIGIAAVFGVAIWIQLEAPEGWRIAYHMLNLATAAVLGVGLYRLTRWMLFRATWKRLRPLWQRLQLTGAVSFDSLMATAAAFGKGFSRAQRFLVWVRRRM